MVVDPETKLAVVVDPGGDFPTIRASVERQGARVVSIVHTHTHIDHVGATAELSRWSGAAAHIHEEDRFLYQMLPIQAALVGIDVPEPCEMLGDLDDDQVVRAGAAELGVMHTPGHTPGSVCFWLRSPSGDVLFAGDTLFRRSIGRTDLWGGDAAVIQRSIKGRIYALDASTRVITGHGPDTTVGEERDKNPFVRGR